MALVASIAAAILICSFCIWYVRRKKLKKEGILLLFGLDAIWNDLYSLSMFILFLHLVQSSEEHVKIQMTNSLQLQTVYREKK